MSVWVEIDKSYLYFFAVIVTLHVSVWVEIHHLPHLAQNCNCHAPRERVSWNLLPYRAQMFELNVTLHVSVWVEIEKFGYTSWTDCVTLHVRVWVEIFCLLHKSFMGGSRSTWACELKFNVRWNYVIVSMSRSTWACELKCTVVSSHWNRYSHAPRERVSWNLTYGLII